MKVYQAANLCAGKEKSLIASPTSRQEHPLPARSGRAALRIPSVAVRARAMSPAPAGAWILRSAPQAWELTARLKDGFYAQTILESHFQCNDMLAVFSSVTGSEQSNETQEQRPGVSAYVPQQQASKSWQNLSSSFPRLFKLLQFSRKPKGACLYSCSSGGDGFPTTLSCLVSARAETWLKTPSASN